MAITKRELFIKQEKYLESRSSTALSELYQGFRQLSRKVSRALIEYHSIPLRGDVVRDIEEEAAVDFITKYLEDPAFRIESSFYSYIRRILQVKYFRPARGLRQDEDALALDEVHSIGSTYYDEETLERIHTEEMAERIVRALTDTLPPDDIREVFPHIIQIIERPGNRSYESYLYRVKNERVRALVAEAMEKIRKEITNHV